MIRGDIKGKGCLELLEGQPDWSHPLFSKLGYKRGKIAAEGSHLVGLGRATLFSPTKLLNLNQGRKPPGSSGDPAQAQGAAAAVEGELEGTVARLAGSFGSIGGVSQPFVSLRTIPILVCSSEGKEITITYLLHDAAQSSFVTKSLARKLHLKGFWFEYITRTVGVSSTKCSALYTQIFITSLSGFEQSDDEDALSVIEPIQVWAIDDTILEYRSADWQELIKGFPHLSEVEVASLPSPNIGILLGNDVSELKICLKELLPPRGLRGPVAHLTPLGWSVIDPVTIYPKNMMMTYESHKMGDYEDVDGQIFDAAAAQAGSVPCADMARVKKLLQMMSHRP